MNNSPWRIAKYLIRLSIILTVVFPFLAMGTDSKHLRACGDALTGHTSSGISAQAASTEGGQATHLINEYDLATELGLREREDVFPGSVHKMRWHIANDRSSILDSAGRTIVIFDFGSENQSRDRLQVRRIYSPLNRQQLSNVLMQIKSVDFSFVLNLCSNIEGEIGWLELPTNVELFLTGRTSIHDKNLDADVRDLRTAENALVQSVQFGAIPFEPSKPTGTTLMVGQGEYAVLKWNDGAYSNVGTYGVASCVGVVLFNDKTKTAAVAHLDAMVDVSGELSKLLRQLGNVQDMRIWLVTSQLDATLMLKIVNFLKSVSIVPQQISQSNDTVAIDVTGKIFNEVVWPENYSPHVMPSVGGLLRRVH